MMNISSILCTVYGKNLQSQNFLTSLVDFSVWLAQKNFFLWPWSVKI